MIDSILALSKNANATGNEKELLAAIEDEAKKHNLQCKYDALGSLIVKISGTEKSQKNVFISCTVDVYGFVCLAVDKDKCFLASTFNSDAKKLENRKLISETKKTYKVSVDKNENIFVCSKSLKIGNFLKEQIQYKKKEHRIIGKFSAKYALIHTLICMFKVRPKHDIIIYFAVQGESACCSQANAVYDLKPDFALLLGATESNAKAPLIVLKDGKIFSDPSLVKTAKSNKIKTSDYISDSKQSITKAESILSHTGVPTLTLALPCNCLMEENEEFNIGTCEKLISLLQSLCTNKL